MYDSYSELNNKIYNVCKKTAYKITISRRRVNEIVA